MCGIAGIISHNTTKINERNLQLMAGCLTHRGPDAQSTWTNDERTAGLAHRRLSIIDLTDAAGQPMHFGERYTIVYNGEIYNYVELKSQLEKKGISFQTASDTEVIIAAYAECGENCVNDFDGMFAFAIWDDHEKTLFCARDRFGEKPFYYSCDNGFYFASGITALHHAGIDLTRDNGMLLQFFATGNIIDAADNARTFYTNIQKLPAAHTLTFRLSDGALNIKKYWEVNRQTRPVALHEVLQQLHELITVSIKRRLRSDVSLGISLSGGLDSAGIALTLNELGVQDMKTFTASFPGFQKDESAKAAGIARHLQFKNYDVVPTANGLAEEFDKVTSYHDEPVATASVYAQFKVFELAARHGVTVLLDGQGADEVFGGYNHYRRWRFRSIMPELTANVLERRELTGMRNYRFADKEFLHEAIKQVHVRKPVVRVINDLLYFDTFCLSLDQLLTYADRNSMAHGREVRLPYLFHELVSFVFTLQKPYKLRDGYTKWVLRKLMENKLPETVWSNRKIGFEPPQKTWMEHRLLQEYMMEQKRKLVREKILDKVVLDQRPAPHEAYERSANEWRWMAAGAFINKKGV